MNMLLLLIFEPNLQITRITPDTSIIAGSDIALRVQVTDVYTNPVTGIGIDYSIDAGGNLIIGHMLKKTVGSIDFCPSNQY